MGISRMFLDMNGNDMYGNTPITLPLFYIISARQSDTTKLLTKKFVVYANSGLIDGNN